MTKRRLCQINVSITVLATILYFLEYLKYRIVAHTKEPFIWSGTTVFQKASALEIHIYFSQSNKTFCKLNCKVVLLLVERVIKMLTIALHWQANHVKLWVSPRILYCVLITGYGLGGSCLDCRPAIPKG